MIKSIKISNYKNLDGFEFDGFGRLNLITGENNVGKTNLLEAIYLAIGKMFVLKNLLYTRNNNINENFDINLNLIETLFTNFNIREVISIETDNEKNKFYFAPIEEKEYKKYIREYDNSFKDSAEYISSNQQIRLKGEVLAEYFTHIIRQNKKNDLLKYLKIIDKNIEDIQILVDDGKANIYLTKNNLSLPISSFGDATQIIFNIFIRIILNENKVILIDEIENGIHYENQKEFWSKLLEISKITSCQIIATTHSIEVIKNFYEVTKDEEDCKLLRLIKDRKNRMKFQEHDKEFIEYQLTPIRNIEETSVLR